MQSKPQKQLEFEKDNINYPILSEADHPEAYAYIDELVQTILVSEEIEFKDKFLWEVKIIDKNVLNIRISSSNQLELIKCPA